MMLENQGVVTDSLPHTFSESWGVYFYGGAKLEYLTKPVEPEQHHKP